MMQLLKFPRDLSFLIQWKQVILPAFPKVTHEQKSKGLVQELWSVISKSFLNRLSVPKSLHCQHQDHNIERSHFCVGEINFNRKHAISKCVECFMEVAKERGCH